MPEQRGLTISAVVAAYQSERFIAEAVQAILSQTRPPDEVIVVDDGSTDGTARELERFAGRIRVIRRENGGCPAAFNTAFAHARGDFVALCGSDDIWEPRKLEWQEQAMLAHPEADVFFGETTLFGGAQGSHARPPGTGLLDGASFRDALYRENVVAAPSVVIRRSLFERLGPFIENYCADDYEYWMRCLRAGARFYYDPRPLIGWRQHENNLSNRRFWMLECSHDVRRRYAADIPNRALVHELLAGDLFRLGRELADQGRAAEARQAFRESLRHWRGSSPSVWARTGAWLAVLSLPPAAREQTGRALIRVKRAAAGAV